MFIQESGACGRGSKVKINPEHLVFSIMERPRIIYEIIKIFQFIVIIILFILFYIVWNSTLISNIDS